jgi:nitrite reductase/ring-hydroxylating ferredoxin subunit
MGVNQSVAQMVFPDRGIISREIFVDPGIYQEELNKVFARAWLFVGHESLIASPGDFFASRMGEESVILCRDMQGTIHVFLNSCRHRGMKICRYEQGHTSTFTCPYHSWSYATDGKLQGVPLYNTLYEGILDRADWSLIEVAKLANYKGAIWATWDPEAPDFLAYLGDAKDHSRCSIAVMGATLVLRSSAFTNGYFRLTGNSRPRTSSAKHTIIQAIVPSTWLALARARHPAQRGVEMTKWRRRSTSGSAFHRGMEYTVRCSRRQRLCTYFRRRSRN